MAHRRVLDHVPEGLHRDLVAQAHLPVVRVPVDGERLHLRQTPVGRGDRAFLVTRHVLAQRLPLAVARAHGERAESEPHAEGEVIYEVVLEPDVHFRHVDLDVVLDRRDELIFPSVDGLMCAVLLRLLRLREGVRLARALDLEHAARLVSSK